MSVSLIPESAPFTEEQRAWLNGFLAGWTGVAEAAANGSANGAAVQQLVAGELTDAGSNGEAAEEEEEFPWHDSALQIDERLDLAEGKPLKRRLMAAMAQLDCGACGYLCQTYSEAIAAGDEKNLTLCSPGGKETAKTLKRLLKEEGGAAKAETNGKPATNGSAAAAGHSRANPFTATLSSAENLNLAGSKKHTTHAVIDLGKDDLTKLALDYEVGDSLGVYPTNCPELVDDVLNALGVGGDDALRQELAEKHCLRTVDDELLEHLAGASTDDAEKQAILGLIDSDELDGLDVLDVLKRTPAAVAASDAKAVIEFFPEIAPRLYSIASSRQKFPSEVHLTIARATATAGERTYKGVASTMFADRLKDGEAVRVYVHRSHGFTTPADPSAPMVMVGPGTGIAPFRAFLQDRAAKKAPGDNWLFFGDQHEATDFLYRDEFNALREQGVLTRLSTAFSRDQEEKVYVQDRMREEGAELMSWLDRGAYFFVCGDAKRMAADVDRALHDVVVQHGGKSMADAMAYVRSLKESGRYARDVY
ncbi:MAG: sulfite reductase subunit alpha [Planctomycetota bacterium]